MRANKSPWKAPNGFQYPIPCQSSNTPNDWRGKPLKTGQSDLYIRVGGGCFERFYLVHHEETYEFLEALNGGEGAMLAHELFA